MSETENIREDRRISVFSLGCGRALVDRIGQALGVPPGRHEERLFEDGEHKIRPLESVRGRDVYVVQSLFGEDAMSVDEKLLRVLFFISTLRDAGAARLTAVIPYLCYARKDVRTKPRDPVTLRYVAMHFEAAGAHRLVTLDVHNPAAFENAFRIPTEHLTAAPSFVEALAPRLGTQATVVVSPDAGGVKRAERFRQALERRLGRPIGSAFVEKFRSEGVVRGGLVVGDVHDRVVVLLDDLISSGTTITRAASACRARGARVIYAAVTHGIFASSASDLLAKTEIDRILLLDTIPPQRIGAALLERFEIIDCSPILAAAIYRLHTDGSLVDFKS